MFLFSFTSFVVVTLLRAAMSVRRVLFSYELTSVTTLLAIQRKRVSFLVRGENHDKQIGCSDPKKDYGKAHHKDDSIKL
jgi:hypothetical protein